MSAHAAGHPANASAARGHKRLVWPRKVMAYKLLFLVSSTAVLLTALTRLAMGVGTQRRRETMTSQQGTAVSAEQATGTKDTTYALVSVLYHALQGAEASVSYLRDATEAGDRELVQFLREAQAWQRYLASQAQALLTQRLRQGDGRVWNPETKIWNLTLMA
jgi:hypothetical protein